MTVGSDPKCLPKLKKIINIKIYIYTHTKYLSHSFRKLWFCVGFFLVDKRLVGIRVLNFFLTLPVII